MKQFFRFQYPALLWAILVFVLCCAPMGSAESKPVFEGFDKLVHTGFFFVLTVFIFFGKIRQHQTSSFRITSILAVFFISSFFGGLIEILQWKVFTYRDGDWWDFFCDVTGVLMGVFGYIFLHRTGYAKSR